ncbi:MAG: T9SS type A sorting domain-containing protein [Flavobacterium sp.]|uniref:T9SS type A sorting domain-containing protein n=1 Tax=Flavobacterium sp. TaxID=239 RepID=UPI00121FFDF2|nr:T9SS type A sorting domain-containing protein [Flavobacterium sp.]RZJ68487.1 MAG: T9SS type A sorting domain-containing protein [Flavobacterium sp.]
MKKLLLFFGLLFLTVSQAQTLEQKMLIDFGSNAGTQGQITPNPDANGNYWNNPISGVVGATTALMNSTNAPSGFSMEVTNNFIVNTSVNYGPTTTTTAALGDLSIATATMDYWYLETAGSGNNSGQVVFHNLNPAKAYKFYIFASRPTNTVRKTAFAFSGLNSFSGQLQTSDGTTGNLTNILATTLLSPTSAGDLTLDVSIVEGTFGYMNVMRIEEYGNLTTVDVTAVTVAGNDITTSAQSSQMTATVSPANATFTSVSWSVDNTAIAVISNSGLLTPVNNGTVTVTATSSSNPEISGTKTINISNQISNLYFSGTATENGDNVASAIPMRRVTGLNNAITNEFEIFTSLTDGTFNFYTSQNGGQIFGAGSSANSLALNGPAIDPAQSGPVYITVNLNTNTYTITPITWNAIGSSTPNGWSGTGLPLNYQGNGVWQATLDLTSVTSDTNPRFVFRGNNSWSYVFKKITGSQNSLVMESVANEFAIQMSDIDLTYGNFIITLNLSNYTYGIQCVAVDDYQITLMGSSGLNGQGATNMQGYAYQYNELLADRATAGSSPFHTSNHAVNGNNTTNVLNRFEKDLLGDCGKYVIFGLVLGNEGVHETGQVAYNSYQANMQLLIQKSQDAGKTPVLSNNYGRGDYNLTDYAFIKQMNIEMAQWNVPTTNLLGATDNGTGNWATGYQDDYLHPNTAGHTELFYAIVPSLFDALEDQKPQPILSTTTMLEIDNAGGAGSFAFTPDNTVHSFTTVLDVKTTASGSLMVLNTDGGTATVSIDAQGHLTYTSAAGNITSTAVVNDGNWHKIALTHYRARGASFLYVDAALSGTVAESLVTTTLTVNPTSAPANVSYRNWFVYRSGMNADEMTALQSNLMLKSSLELYAPLDGTQTGSAIFTNLAQSTNTVDGSNYLGVAQQSGKTFSVWPNPVKNVLHLSTEAETIEVFDVIGQRVRHASGANSISFDGLSKGIYLVKLTSDKNSKTIKVIKE